MKTKKTLLLACTFFVLPFVASPLFAQQTKTVLPATPTPKTPLTGADVYATYSFRIYNAPDNAFGYDLLKNGKPVYHQFVLMFVSNEGKRVFATKPQTQRVAMIAIDKVRNGQQPEFSNEEIKKLLSL